MGISYFLGIRHCYNFIFCFILTVHGDIRHLENIAPDELGKGAVHGDIRHLENVLKLRHKYSQVHGDIRHLENT